MINDDEKKFHFRIDTMARSGIIEYFDIDGSYQTITGGQVVNKDDLIELAKVAQNKNLYDKAITYLQEASRYVCYWWNNSVFNHQTLY